MKAPSRRPEQVAETVRQVVASALAVGEVRDPRIGFATVSRVDVTNDLSHAKIFVSVPGEPADRAKALAGLQSAAGFLRSRVAKALTTRIAPELHFEIDQGLAHAARIGEILAALKKEED